jgi:hypothetical protein
VYSVVHYGRRVVVPVSHWKWAKANRILTFFFVGGLKWARGGINLGGGEKEALFVTDFRSAANFGKKTSKMIIFKNVEEGKSGNK